ncbi:hypothetical protein GF359_08510 [candidate division WOR-3 bacterium]|uniref:Leucine-rich repeat domain-containing protein n=1 Tax=candidate division WOR-3 bacterium TaxID=2052148 RepID=A0A9D5KCR8_UNCW3|nr:hypothetical protein [candidate division WOR-3 bacterium]MBD3365241.1 hypothetical protein [candidate division WOR-3 bacterium]
MLKENNIVWRESVKDLTKYFTRLALVLLTGTFALGQEVERTFLTVTREGIFDFRVETTDWTAGEKFIDIGGYKFLWTGQEEIDYQKGLGTLEIEGRVAGVDLTPEESGELAIIHRKEAEIARRDISGALSVKIDTAYWHILRQVKNPLALKGGLSDKYLRRLRRYESLRGLWAWGEGITCEGLQHLKRLSRLTELSLAKTSITDSGLVHLNDLSSLRKLDLSGNHITGSGFSTLSGLYRLEYLDVSNTGFTDEGLGNLQFLTNLKILNLEGSMVTDTGLVYLEELIGLRRLILKNSEVKITSPQALRLKQVLPDCELVFF